MEVEYECIKTWKWSISVWIPGSGVWVYKDLEVEYECMNTWKWSMSVWRPGSSVADPGCLSLVPDPDFYPSRIPDLGSKNSNKREGWKEIFFHTFLCSHKFHKIEHYFSFEVLKKKIWANFQRIIELFTQKTVTKLSKIWVRDPGSKIRDPEKTYSGSRIQGSKRHRIPDPDPQHCLEVEYECMKTWKWSMSVWIPGSRVWVFEYLEVEYECLNTWKWSMSVWIPGSGVWMFEYLEVEYECLNTWKWSRSVWIPGSGVGVFEYLEVEYECMNTWKVCMSVWVYEYLVVVYECMKGVKERRLQLLEVEDDQHGQRVVGHPEQHCHAPGSRYK